MAPEKGVQRAQHAWLRRVPHAHVKRCLRHLPGCSPAAAHDFPPRFDTLAGLRPGGTVLVNAKWKSFEEMEKHMHPVTRSRIAQLRPKARACLARPAGARHRTCLLGADWQRQPPCRPAFLTPQTSTLLPAALLPGCRRRGRGGWPGPPREHGHAVRLLRAVRRDEHGQGARGRGRSWACGRAAVWPSFPSGFCTSRAGWLAGCCCCRAAF